MLVAREAAAAAAASVVAAEEEVARVVAADAAAAGAAAAADGAAAAAFADLDTAAIDSLGWSGRGRGRGRGRAPRRGRAAVSAAAKLANVALKAAQKASSAATRRLTKATGAAAKKVAKNAAAAAQKAAAVAAKAVGAAARRTATAGQLSEDGAMLPPDRTLDLQNANVYNLWASFCAHMQTQKRDADVIRNNQLRARRSPSGARSPPASASRRCNTDRETAFPIGDAAGRHAAGSRPDRGGRRDVDALRRRRRGRERARQEAGHHKLECAVEDAGRHLDDGR